MRLGGRGGRAGPHGRTAGRAGRAHHRRGRRAREGRGRAVRGRGRQVVIADVIDGADAVDRHRGRRWGGDRRGLRRDRRGRRPARRGRRRETSSAASRALQQRRGHARRRRRSGHDAARGVRADDGHQRQGRAARVPTRHPRDAGQRGRIDHQRRVVRRPHGRRHAADRLHGLEGRGAGHDTRDRGRPTPARACGPTRCAPGRS